MFSVGIFHLNIIARVYMEKIEKSVGIIFSHCIDFHVIFNLDYSTTVFRFILN